MNKKLAQLNPYQQNIAYFLWSGQRNRWERQEKLVNSMNKLPRGVIVNLSRLTGINISDVSQHKNSKKNMTNRIMGLYENAISELNKKES